MFVLVFPLCVSVFLKCIFPHPLSINTVVLVHPDQSVLFLLVLSVSVVEYGQVTPFSCANGIYNVLTILFYYFLGTDFVFLQ